MSPTMLETMLPTVPRWEGKSSPRIMLYLGLTADNLFDIDFHILRHGCGMLAQHRG